MSEEHADAEKQKSWAGRKRRQGLSPAVQLKLVEKQKGKCALSGVKMLFDLKDGTPKEGRGNGCHPLYAAIDHIEPGCNGRGHQIVCFALNDLKGHLSFECFEALRRTKAWKQLMHRWMKQAKSDSTDREAFRSLIRAKQN